MSETDYAYWTALTAPMKTAGEMQKSRQADALKAIQLIQNQKNQQLKSIEQQNAIQKQFNTASSAAMSSLYTTIGTGDNKKTFHRKKDIDDFKVWHESESGWADIQSLLREYGNIDNARLNGNLDYYIQQYQYNLSNNPISKRVNSNKDALTNYYKYALDVEGGASLLTHGVHTRFNQYNSGEIDNFVFHGPRTDYLSDVNLEKYGENQNITMDAIISNNYTAIVKDMVNDQNPENVEEFINNLSYDHLKAFVTKELNWNESTSGVDYFADKAYYGTREIDTEMSTEIIRSLDAVQQTGILNMDDVIAMKEGNISFRDIFNKVNDGKLPLEFERLGGINHGKTAEAQGRFKPFYKNRQLVSSDEIFANDNVRTGITEAWAGNFSGDQSNVSRYDRGKRKIYGVDMLNGVYNDYGHKIVDSDISPSVISKSEAWTAPWEESPKMNLELEGYFVALKATGKDAQGRPQSALLVSTEDENDWKKMKDQWGEVQFQHVIVAQLNDTDYASYDEKYYKELNMSDPNIQTAINNKFNSDNLNNVLSQSAKYEQEKEFKKQEIKRIASLKQKLVKQLNVPNEASVDQLVDGYDQSLSIGLRLANIPSKKVNAVMPMIISDLYVNSQEPRQYPHKFKDGTVAKNSSQYMAYTAKALQFGLQNDASFGSMKEAIMKGPSAYDEWRKRNIDEKQYKNSYTLAKDLAKYYNL